MPQMLGIAGILGTRDPMPQMLGIVGSLGTLICSPRNPRSHAPDARDCWIPRGPPGRPRRNLKVSLGGRTRDFQGRLPGLLRNPKVYFQGRLPGRFRTQKCTFRVAFWVAIRLQKCTFRVTFYEKTRGFRSPTLKISILHPGLLCSQSRGKRFVVLWGSLNGFDLAGFQLQGTQEQRVFEKRV